MFHEQTRIYNDKNNLQASDDQLDTHMARLGSSTYYVPLRFWFNNNPGLALPLISLQYHEVKLNIFWREIYKRAFGGNVPLRNISD
jgi:hypothetical protein